MDTDRSHYLSRFAMAWMFVACVAIGSTPAVASSATFSKTGSMNVARDGQTATLLANGEVLVAGGMNNTSGFLASSELYNPATGKWMLEGNMSIGRFYHNAVLLNNGKVLLVGGLNPNQCCQVSTLATAELFYPATGQWTLTGSMSTVRENFVLIALPNGKVLAAGGNPYPGLTSAELYDPTPGTWSSTGSTEEGLQESEAVLLPSGKVFAFCNREIYDPVMGTWSTAPSPAPSNQGTVDFMTLLQSGQVWVGNNDELFNPSTSEWTNFGPPSCLISGRQDCGGGAALLGNGQVLVAGGTKEVEISGAPDRRIQTQTLTTAVLWNPATQGWTSTGDLQVSRTGQTMTRLLNGQVLVAGGETFEKGSGALVPIAAAELYTP